MPREANEILYEYAAHSDGTLKILKTQDCEQILKTVHHIPEMTSMKKLLKANQRYLGTVPNVIGLQWANEAGVRMFSREWHEVVKKKFHDPQWAKLKVTYPRSHRVTRRAAR